MRAVFVFSYVIIRMSPEEIIDLLTETNPDALLADGFLEALVGTVHLWAPVSSGGATQTTVALYDYQKMIGILVKRDGMTPDEADEYLQFNTLGGYVGENQPAYCNLSGEMGVPEVDDDEPEMALNYVDKDGVPHIYPKHKVEEGGKFIGWRNPVYIKPSDFEGTDPTQEAMARVIAACHKSDCSGNERCEYGPCFVWSDLNTTSD